MVPGVRSIRLPIGKLIFAVVFTAVGGLIIYVALVVILIVSSWAKRRQRSAEQR